MRRQYKLTIGVIILIALYFLVCYKHYSVPEGVSGTIFVLRSHTYAYNPSKDIITEFPNPTNPYQPRFQCKLEADTIIASFLKSRSGKDWISGYYKQTPFETKMTKIEMLGDNNWSTKHLDYNQELELFLFFGKLNSDTVNLFILNRELEIVRDISFVLDRSETYPLERNFYLLDSMTILFNSGEELRMYSLIDSSSKIISTGALGSLSHDRKKAVLRVGAMDEQVNILFDLGGSPNVKLPPITASGFCFSPDDSYLACLHSTNDLSNTVELHIYDINKKEMHLTRMAGWGGLVWVNRN